VSTQIDHAEAVSRVPSALRASLRCPRCRSTLQAEIDVLACTACNARYPCVDGVPVLIDEERSLFDIASIVQQAAVSRSTPQRGSRLGALLPTLSRNYRAADNFRLLRSELDAAGARSVLIVGGGTEPLGIDELLRPGGLDVVETDVFIGSATTAVCDAHQIPFADETFDAVIVQGVICYLQDPAAALGEIWRVLKLDGWVYSETPFVQQVTGGRFDFVRYTGIGHRRLFQRFTEHSSGPVGGPAMVLAWSWHYFLLTIASTRRMRSLMSALARLTAFWLLPLDRWLGRRPWTIDAASGVFFLGRKDTVTLPDREVIRGYTGGVGV
jgi:SAM-dependent methyltransferase